VYVLRQNCRAAGWWRVKKNLDEFERQRAENRERQKRRREHRSQEERDIENERRILIFC
jgi:hypothetical protein